MDNPQRLNLNQGLDRIRTLDRLIGAEDQRETFAANRRRVARLNGEDTSMQGEHFAPIVLGDVILDKSKDERAPEPQAQPEPQPQPVAPTPQPAAPQPNATGSKLLPLALTAAAALTGAGALGSVATYIATRPSNPTPPPATSEGDEFSNRDWGVQIKTDRDAQEE